MTSRVGVISVYMDYHQRGRHDRGVLQPQVGPLIAGLLPDDAEVEVVNDVWDEPDWSRSYDLLFLSSLHSDFDRARQISHYWRRRGARTVYGGPLATSYPELCRPYFDSVAVGDPEGTVDRIYRDFKQGRLEPVYRSAGHDGSGTPVPRVELLADQQLLPLSIELTRGCPFRCEFCVLTGLGTRYVTRSASRVVEDLRQARRRLNGSVRWPKNRFAVFPDNNIGGNPKYLLELCEEIRPLGLRWGSSATFNVIKNPELVEALSGAGCRFLFVGLESFNPEAIQDMNKRQNVIDEIRAALDLCRSHGILIVSGMMVSPIVDTAAYMASIPERVRECGLHLPSFVCFECPIPGTPHFHRLAAEPGESAFLPNALLRDFSAYTLVTRPRRETLEDFVAAYRRLLDELYGPGAKMRKLLHDLPSLIAPGHLLTALVDIGHVRGVRCGEQMAHRTFIAGTEPVPPEVSSVPFAADDFRDEAERRRILEPTRVTDADGRVLPQWLHSRAASAA